MITKEFLQKEYINKKRNTNDIGKELGISHAAVVYWLKKYDIKIRSRGDSNKFDFNEDFFSTPNLNNSYWAGFIAADGCIKTPNIGQNILNIHLMDQDYEHLVKFKNDIGWEGNIYRQGQRGHSKPSSTINLASNKLCNDLTTNFNITPRKSLTLEAPNLSGDLALSFICGYIDGDGCIRTIRDGDLVCNICGTYDILFWIKNQLNKIETIETNVLNYKSIKTFNIYGKKAYKVLSIINQLSIPKLDRKWNILNQCKGE